MKIDATPPRPAKQATPPEAEIDQALAIQAPPATPEAPPQVGQEVPEDEWMALKKKKVQDAQEEALNSPLNSEWQIGGLFQAPEGVDAQLMAQASPAPSATRVIESRATTGATATSAATSGETTAASSTAGLAAAPSFAPLLALGALGMGGGGGGGGGAALTNNYEPMPTAPMVSLSDIQVVGGPVRDTMKFESPELSDGDDERPRVITLGNGGMAVTWYGEDGNGDNSIFVQVIQANGRSQGSPVKLEGLGVTDGHDYAPELAALGNDGSFVVTWYGKDNNGDSSVFVQRFNAQGQPSGQMIQLEALNRTDGHDLYPKVAALGDAGRFVLTWFGDDVRQAGQTADDKSIFVQMFDAAGQPSGALVQLEPTGVTNGLDQAPQVMELGTDGRFVVAWEGLEKQGDQSILVQLFDSDGQRSGDLVLLEALNLTTGADYAPQLALLDSSGRFVVTWYGRDRDGDASVYVSTFSANGQPTGVPVKLEALGVTDGLDYAQTATALGDEGRFVVVWSGQDSSTERDYSIFVQTFDATGQPSGEMVQLEPTGVNDKTDFEPQVKALGSDGRFVVAWYGNDVNSDFTIYVQLFGSDGQASGTMHRLEAPDRTGGGSDTFPQLTALDNGGFAVVWSGQDGGGDKSIYLQRFDAEGQPVQQAYASGEVVTVTYDPTTNNDVSSVQADFSMLGGPAVVVAQQHTTGQYAGLWVATYTVPDNHLPHSNAQIRLTVTDTSSNATSVTDGALLSLTTSAIDLGEYGQLLAPVQEGDQWYYLWDRNGDGVISTDVSLGGGLFATDLSTSEELQTLFGDDQTVVIGNVELRLPTLIDDQFVKVQVSAVL
jgi:hypothetical protein